MGRLKDLFDRGTGGNCHKWEHYFEIYERYCDRFVNTPCTYLEIGVQRGGSLAIMTEYLGPQARVIGVDVDPQCAALRQAGFEIHIGDQADRGFLETLAKETGPYDIILDDGGHTADQQLAAFMTLFPHLKDGGLYIVEDMHAHFWHAEYQESRWGINFFDFAKGLIEKLSLWHLDIRDFPRMATPRHARGEPMKIKNFATNEIFGIHFYDSLIVFEKRKMQEPYTLHR
jgi:SAM-dependent methyltransferase